MKQNVQVLYICDAEVVKVASPLLPVVSLHTLDLLPSAETFFVFLGVHENNLSHTYLDSAPELMSGFRPVELVIELTLPICDHGCAIPRWFTPVMGL